MIFNPVRSGGGKPKQVEVGIKLGTYADIRLYCIKDGKYIDYYNGDSPSGSSLHNATVDAGSLFVVIVIAKKDFPKSHSNCTLEIQYTLSSGYRLGIFKANDA